MTGYSLSDVSFIHRAFLDPKVFLDQRKTLARDLYNEFNKTVFEFQLSHAFEITWSPYLRKTAGRTHTLEQVVQ